MHTLGDAARRKIRFSLREVRNHALKSGGLGSKDAVARGESGASLILALVFLIVVSLIVISIAGLTAADLRLTSSFGAAQSMTAAADGATSVAVQQARYVFDASTLNTPAPCDAASPTQNFNAQTVQSWCDTQWSPQSAATRTVIVSTCPSTVTAGVACEASPLLQAIVVFDDYPASSSYASCSPIVAGVTPTFQNKTCGSQMVLQSWAFNVAPPIVTNIAPVTSGQNLCSATSVTITGSGFTPSSSVELVSATQFSQNIVVDATVSNVTTTSITASYPAVASGSGTFYVVVTGSTGSNPYGSTTSTPSFTC